MIILKPLRYVFFAKLCSKHPRRYSLAAFLVDFLKKMAKKFAQTKKRLYLCTRKTAVMPAFLEWNKQSKKMVR